MTLIYIFGGIFAGWAMLTLLGSERSRLKSQSEAGSVVRPDAKVREEIYTAQLVSPSVPSLGTASKPAAGGAPKGKAKN